MMTRCLVLFGAMWALPQADAADAPLPKAEALMDRYVEVTGGKAAYEKRRNEVMTISIEVVGKGIKGSTIRYTDAGNNALSTGELEGIGKIEEGVYNGHAWEVSAVLGPRVKSGDENRDAVRDAIFNPAITWRTLYRAETVGVEPVNGEECYRVKLSPLDGAGSPHFNLISKKSGLIVKAERTMASALGEVPVSAVMSDYKEFEGIQYPTRIVQSVMGNDVALTLDSLKANQDLPKNRFEPPAEIKKLLAK